MTQTYTHNSHTIQQGTTLKTNTQFANLPKNIYFKIDTLETTNNTTYAYIHKHPHSTRTKDPLKITARSITNALDSGELTQET